VYTHKREMKFITAQNMSATMDRRKILRPSLCMLPSLPIYVPPVVVATIITNVCVREPKPFLPQEPRVSTITLEEEVSGSSERQQNGPCARIQRRQNTARARRENEQRHLRLEMTLMA